MRMLEAKKAKYSGPTPIRASVFAGQALNSIA